MFGLSFSEIIIIALVALIVIGPERLPKTARALGLLMGRAQRYVNDIKSDIEREMHVDDIKKFKDEVASNVSKAKSSVEGEITSITNPIKSITNPLDTVKSEVKDLEQQLKGSLNPLPNLDSLKLDEAAETAASVPLTEAPKTVASSTVSRGAAAVSAGVSSASAEAVTRAGAESTMSDVLQHQQASTPRMRSVDSTVAEALIYPEEQDESLAAGADVLRKRWIPDADDSTASGGSAASGASASRQQLTSAYDGPSYEPPLAPERDAEALEADNAAWDAYVAEHESPINADKSLAGLALWEQKPGAESAAVSLAQHEEAATNEASNKNTSSSNKGGSHV
ncbi:Sec-independent protein translocase protein TatB [Oligella urethralis]|uniref:Sec-independent protein translocase protein TatB n=1 Tax=Oligella urethralis TaxID=90245 RepID=UPI000E067FF3|nr:Sec-independent protein translocase protein TatB [Oligella urethralis]SUA55525.1 Sec-independent protein translocase protein TatB [Oligella urethralis]